MLLAGTACAVIEVALEGFGVVWAYLFSDYFLSRNYVR